MSNKESESGGAAYGGHPGAVALARESMAGGASVSAMLAEILKAIANQTQQKNSE